MSKIEKFHLISDGMILNRDHKILEKELPRGNRWCYSFFWDEEESEGQIERQFSQYVRDNFINDKQKIYLFTIGGHGWTYNIRKYYKLWNPMKKTYNLDHFILGSEYEILFNDTLCYCGVAKVDKYDMDIAMNILLNERDACFMYIANEEIDIHNSKVKDFFQEIIVTDSHSHSEYDYIEIYNRIKQREYIINILFDGEEVGLNIGEIY